MVRGGAYLTARTLIEVPVMLLLAICTLSVGGYGIANLYAPSFVQFIAMFAAVLWYIFVRGCQCLYPSLSVSLALPLPLPLPLSLSPSVCLTHTQVVRGGRAVLLSAVREPADRNDELHERVVRLLPVCGRHDCRKGRHLALPRALLHHAAQVGAAGVSVHRILRRHILGSRHRHMPLVPA